MQNALLLSVLVAMIAIPVLASRDPSPVRGLRRVIVLTIVFNTLYMLMLRYVYPRMQ